MNLKVVSCTSLYNILTIKTFTSTVTVSDFTLTISLNSGITNPSSIFNDPTIISIKDSNKTIKDSNNNLVFVYSAIIISDINIDNLNKNAGEMTFINYSFTPKFPIPIGAYIRLDFPMFNENSGATSDQLYSTILSINTGPGISNATVKYTINYLKFREFILLVILTLIF